MKALCRWFLLLMAVLVLMAQPAAASSVSSVRTTAQVASDGSARVTVRYQFSLDAAQSLSVDLPQDAKNVRLDGKLKTPAAVSTGLRVHLGTLNAGAHTVELSFTLDDAVTEGGGQQTLEIPLLTGCALAVEYFSFSVTLPGEPEQAPVLVSGYYGTQTERLIEYTCIGNTVAGTATAALLGQETLTLRCAATAALLPNHRADSGLPGPWVMATVGLLALAALYYLVALLPAWPGRVRTFGPPEGLGAGDMATCLTGCGMDLTMTVFTWAQLGYLSMEADGRGRILLQKRMDMGTERSEFENRAFRKLFSHGDRVDGQGLHYALLCRHMAQKSPLLRQIYRSRSGNPKLVTALCVAAGGCGGVVLSRGVYTAGAGTVLLALLLAAVGALLSWLIHRGSRCLPLGNPWPVLAALAAGVGWLGLGRLCGNVLLAAIMAACQFFSGVAAAIGGKRSALGRLYLAQIRGLRAHLTRGSVFDMQQCQQKNPAYFFDLLPYALALGVERRFARRFGKNPLPQCGYFTAPQAQSLTPSQWAAVLRRTADRLDRRQRRLQLEKIIAKQGGKA